MIHDVDESLRALVKREALNGSRIDIAFDAPTREWAARQNAPAINIYLYDIREDLDRREVAWERVRDDNGRVAQHRQPARRFRLSYLVTAWTQRPEDEHRLLSAVLAACLRHPYIPPDVAVGAIADSPVPSYLTVALPPPEDRPLPDVWTALGGELKPSLDLVVTAPMDASRRIEAAPPVVEHPLLKMVGVDGDVEYANAQATGEARRHRRRGPLSPADAAAQEETIVPGGSEGKESAKATGRPTRRGVRRVDADAESSTAGRRITVRGFPRP